MTSITSGASQLIARSETHAGFPEIRRSAESPKNTGTFGRPVVENTIRQLELKEIQGAVNVLKDNKLTPYEHVDIQHGIAAARQITANVDFALGKDPLGHNRRYLTKGSGADGMLKAWQGLVALDQSLVNLSKTQNEPTRIMIEEARRDVRRAIDSIPISEIPVKPGAQRQ